MELIGLLWLRGRGLLLAPSGKQLLEGIKPSWVCSLF